MVQHREIPQGASTTDASQPERLYAEYPQWRGMPDTAAKSATDARKWVHEKLEKWTKDVDPPNSKLTTVALFYGDTPSSDPCEDVVEDGVLECLKY